MKKFFTMSMLSIMLCVMPRSMSTVKVAPMSAVRKSTIKPRGLKEFLRRMALIESDNNIGVVNKYGMMGKYQFHPRTLQSVGIRAAATEFLNSEKLQDSAMVLYMKMNARELKPIIRKFSGTVFNGVKITRSGILASAHLVGSLGVWSYFYPDKFTHKTSDANGANVGMYMKRFENFNLGI